MHAIPTRIPGVSIDKLERELGNSTVALRLRRERNHNLSTIASNSQRKWRTTEVSVERGLLSEPSFLTQGSAIRRYRCIRGKAYFVAVDLRKGSPTYSRWLGISLCEGDYRRLRIPAGVACGWIAVSSTTRLRMQVNRAVQSKDWQRLKWNDRQIDIAWPLVPRSIVSTPNKSRTLSNIPSSILPSYSDFQSVTRKKSSARNQAPSSERNCAVVRIGGRASIEPTTVSATSSEDGYGENELVSVPLSLQSPYNLNLKQDATSLGSTEPIQKISSLSQTTENSMRTTPLILVIGSSGQLGQDLCRHLKSIGTVIGACRSPDRNRALPVPIEVDISRPASLRQVIRQVRPNVIVNASGMTDIDRAEAEPRLAQMVNATAPSIMAEEAHRCGAAMVHFCTDMVFRGDGERPFNELDPPSPTCQYAITKLIGTQAICCSGIPHLVLRSGWLYSTHGDNFVRSIMDMSIYRNSLSLAGDHYGSPTSTDWLAEITTSVLSNSLSQPTKWLDEHGGLYHCATLGYASRAEVAEQIVADCRQQGMPVVLKKIHSVPLGDLPSLARRPTNCRLDCSRITTRFGISLPRWQDQLTQKIDLMVGNVRALRNWVA